MPKLASANPLWSSMVLDLPAREAQVWEVAILRELEPAELAVWEREPLESRVRLLCGACSPWDEVASVRYVKRQLSIIRASANERERFNDEQSRI